MSVASHSNKENKMTFMELKFRAKKHGIIVERNGKKIDCWFENDSIITECHSLEEAIREVNIMIAENNGEI